MSDTVDGEEEPIPISLVAHHVFCPRRAWLEANGERVESAQMEIGLQRHAASDDPTASRRTVRRAVEVASGELGVVGKCDTVELEPDGSAWVVEHKATPVRRRAEVTEPLRVQVALQAAALEDSGVPVVGAAVYFTEHHTRIEVPYGPLERARARDHVTATRATLSAETAPPPLEDDPRCLRCSHVGVCLPDERTLGAVRPRVKVADPDSQILHVATPGARASIRTGRVHIVKGEEKLGSVPVERVLGLVLHGNVDVSGGLIRELLWRGLTIVWCSGSGRVVGWASSATTPNAGARVRQHVHAANGHLGLAREFVVAKIANQATLLRRHGDSVEVVARLRALQRNARQATSIEQVLGVEGDAAAAYFRAFSTMLSSVVGQRDGIGFVARTRRPAADPVNAALNFCYGLLLADVTRAVVACGMDPRAGFLHSSGRNKPALALDLSEEFRAPVADSVVLGAFNNGELRGTSFSKVLEGCRLRDSGRTALISAYERRVMTEFQHPLFGYRVSWRRAMEVQARLVLGVLDGTQPSYRGIAVR